MHEQFVICLVGLVSSNDLKGNKEFLEIYTFCGPLGLEASSTTPRNIAMLGGGVGEVS